MTEWISVKDRLPDTDHYVLCYQDKAACSIKVGFRSTVSRVWFPNLDKVTHWMPLPEFPK
jgi:uncharacterized protein DUF551